MKDENIKEILEDVKRHLDYVKATKQASIRDNEMKAMYDYITNLQTIEQQYSAILSENAELENKITNLQNENMKYDQCLTELTDNYKDLQKELTNLQEENERLKEYIKIANVSEWFKGNDELDNLLQGKSDE